jgi:hypothetical protein
MDFLKKIHSRREVRWTQEMGGLVLRGEVGNFRRGRVVKEDSFFNLACARLANAGSFLLHRKAVVVRVVS